MDYSFFDSLIDCAFVINGDKHIVYCNESAATLCSSSVRRMTKGKAIFEFIEFEDTQIYAMPNGEKGKEEAMPYIEMKFKAIKAKETKEGKVQVAIQPFTGADGEAMHVIMVRDVTLEEVLHKKYHAQLEAKEDVIKELKIAQGQLEAYSKNLEKMVAERTAEVQQANKMLSAIMDSLGQGFLVFDQSGNCGEIYTKACETILETNPANKSIAEVLQIGENEMSSFEMWLKVSFDESLPFDSLKDLGPSVYNHSENKHVTLDFYPIRTEGKITNIVLVATDKTAEREAQLALEKEKAYAQMIVKIISSRKQVIKLLEEAPSMINEVKSIASKIPFDHELAFRILHTFEGEAGTYSLTELWSASREVQEVIEPLKKGFVDSFDGLKQNFFIELTRFEEIYKRFIETNKKVLDVIGFGAKGVFEIGEEEATALIIDLKTRGIPAEHLQIVEDVFYKESFVKNFKHYNELVESVSEKLGKKINPIIFKNDIRINIKTYSNLLSTFVHMFRNSVDHGIEAPEERVMMGKNESGTIIVGVNAIDNYLTIEVEDDGGGINPEIIKEKLKQSRSNAAVDNMSDDEVIQSVFDSGVSSKDSVGEFSGRGIGMNAIKDEAMKLGGNAWVESAVGQGTKLVVKVPLLGGSERVIKVA